MKEVEIYTWVTCPFCIRAKALLDRKDVDYKEYDATLPEIRAEMSKRAGGKTSVPQIFINGSHIGGCDELHALEEKGELDGLLGEENDENGMRPA